MSMMDWFLCLSPILLWLIGMVMLFTLSINLPPRKKKDGSTPGPRRFSYTQQLEQLKQLPDWTYSRCWCKDCIKDLNHMGSSHHHSAMPTREREHHHFLMMKSNMPIKLDLSDIPYGKWRAERSRGWRGCRLRSLVNSFHRLHLFL